MNYRYFFEGSIPVSEIGLGAWQLGRDSGWKSMSEAEALNLVARSLDHGINFFDTAPNYGHGTGEERLGKGLKGVDRDRIVINTKFGHTHEGTMNYSASYIRESLEGSLRRLDVDYVDSLIIHNPPSECYDGNKNDHYEVLEKLKDEGKIKAYGASLDTFEDMKMLLKTTGSRVIEAFFNIHFQDTRNGFAMAQDLGVGIIAKIPLDSGWLTGKYSEKSTFIGVRSRWSEAEIKQRARLVERVKEIVGEEELATKALAFCLGHEAVSTIIPGNINIEQLNANVKAANWRLDQDQMDALHRFYVEEVKAENLPW
jgi:aryl-alcohol dehydrogenase-like predicted oxidoreductase